MSKSGRIRTFPFHNRLASVSQDVLRTTFALLVELLLILVRIVRGPCRQRKLVHDVAGDEILFSQVLSKY